MNHPIKFNIKKLSSSNENEEENDRSSESRDESSDEINKKDFKGTSSDDEQNISSDDSISDSKNIKKSETNQRIKINWKPKKNKTRNVFIPNSNEEGFENEIEDDTNDYQDSIIEDYSDFCLITKQRIDSRWFSTMDNQNDYFEIPLIKIPNISDPRQAYFSSLFYVDDKSQTFDSLEATKDNSIPRRITTKFIHNKSRAAISVSGDVSQRPKRHISRRIINEKDNEIDVEQEKDDPDFSDETEQKIPKRAPSFRGPVTITRNEDGEVKFPLDLGSLVIIQLGTVVWDKECFHSKRYIFPLGFTSKRLYYSLADPSKRCWYTQEILLAENNNDDVKNQNVNIDENIDEPLFRLTCEDLPNEPLDGQTPSGVWAEVLERIRPYRESVLKRKLFSTISGPEQYGLSHKIVHHLIESLPNASLCQYYDPKVFDAPPSSEPKKRRKRRHEA